MQRRRFLSQIAAGIAAVPLAGCVGAFSGSTPTPTPDPTHSGDRGPTPTEMDFAVENRECGTADNTAAVTFGDDAVRIDGVIGGRDTCDIARLASARVHLDVLKVVVEVTEESHTTTVACGQCLTDIEYTFRASGLRGGPARVRVVHRTADGEQTVTVADRN